MKAQFGRPLLEAVKITPPPPLRVQAWAGCTSCRDGPEWQNYAADNRLWPALGTGSDYLLQSPFPLAPSMTITALCDHYSGFGDDPFGCAARSEPRPGGPLRLSICWPWTAW
jgi:hypothetical protein